MHTAQLPTTSTRVHHTVYTIKNSQIITDIMMVGTLVDRQHHATVHQSSDCPLQLSAEQQNSDAPPSPLLADGGLRRLRGASWGCCGSPPHRKAKYRTSYHAGHAPSFFLIFPRSLWCDV